MPAVTLIKGDSVDNNVDYRDSLPVNMYAVPKPILGAAGYLLNFYGLTQFSTGQGIDRGGIWVSRDGFEGHYRVSGTFLISVDQNGISTTIGMIPGTDQVSMDYSFNNLAIVADGKLYYYNPTSGLRQITDPDIGSPIDIVWVDGFFFLTDGESIYHSTLANEEVFEPLDFANAEFIPDVSRGLAKSEENEVVVFGEFSTEYFVNTGGENFSFQRITRKAQKIGIVGTHAKREMYGKFYCVTRRIETSPAFTVIGLGSETSISTREVEKVLGEYTDDSLQSIVIDGFVDDAVKFVIYHLENHTLMFNITIAERLGVDNAWTILKTDVLGDLPYRGKNIIRDPRNGKWVCGDRRDSKIGELDPSICTHYGDIAEWLLFTPFMKIEALSIDKLEIETIPGIAPDEDATVFISLTYNGRTYGKEWTQLYGDNFDYSQRFYVRRLGNVRDWVGIKIRGASRSRMAFGLLDLEYS